MSRLARLVLALLLAFALGPFLWAVLASLRPEAELFGGASLLPERLVAGHYAALFAERGFGVPIRNSLVVAGTTTLLCLALGAPAAWALARLALPGKAAVLGFVLAVSTFPQISIVSPLFLLLRSAGLIDTWPGLVLPYLTFALPLTLWLLVGTVRQIPVELEEAARVDGAGRLQVFTRVVLPLAAPGLATAGILTFLACWNELLFALSFTLGPERQTVPVAMALFRGQYQVPWGQVMAAAVVATAPVVLLVLLVQRRIAEGLTGALKG